VIYQVTKHLLDPDIIHQMTYINSSEDKDSNKISFPPYFHDMNNINDNCYRVFIHDLFYSTFSTISPDWTTNDVDFIRVLFFRSAVSIVKEYITKQLSQKLIIDNPVKKMNELEISDEFNRFTGWAIKSTSDLMYTQLGYKCLYRAEVLNLLRLFNNKNNDVELNLKPNEHETEFQSDRCDSYDEAINDDNYLNHDNTNDDSYDYDDDDINDINNENILMELKNDETATRSGYFDIYDRGGLVEPSCHLRNFSIFILHHVHNTVRYDILDSDSMHSSMSYLLQPSVDAELRQLFLQAINEVHVRKGIIIEPLTNLNTAQIYVYMKLRNKIFHARACNAIKQHRAKFTNINVDKIGQIGLRPFLKSMGTNM
jgi:hypothetical protein